MELLKRDGHILFLAFRCDGYAAHLKVPGWSLVCNKLLIKKLPMFLTRLIEISGGCEKIILVSSETGYVRLNAL